MRISVVGGVHYNLVKRVFRDLKKSKLAESADLNENSVLQSIFSSYKEHVEPHLQGAHIMVKNDFDHLAQLREPLYVLLFPHHSKIHPPRRHLSPPSMNEVGRPGFRF